MSHRAWTLMVIGATLSLALIGLGCHFQEKAPFVALGMIPKGGAEVTLQAAPEIGGKLKPEELEQRMQEAMVVVEKRVDPRGSGIATVKRVGKDRLLVRVAGKKSPDSIIEMIGETALLEFLNTGDQSFEAGTAMNDPTTGKRKKEYAKYETIMTGADIKTCSVGFDQGSRPYIAFELTKEAASLFGEYTNNHIGQYLTVLLDGMVLTSPVIKGAIWGGKGIIEGNFSLPEAQKIVSQLNAGALPIPFTIVDSSVVKP